MNPLARKILAILAELDEDTLLDCYGIRRTASASLEEADLDAAILDWKAAGCPIDDAEPDPISLDVQARLDALRESVDALRESVDASPLHHKYRVAELTVFCFGRTDDQVDDLTSRLIDRIIDEDCLYVLCETRWAEVLEAEELEGDTESEDED